jgi:autotransporter adhesin
VANGVAPNDAVNVQQLNAGVASANAYTDARVNGLQGNIDGVARKAYAGVASAMALESAPYIAGKTTYAAGMGYYQSQGAVGIALRRTADNGRWSVTGGVSASAGGVAVRAGVSGIWD